MSNFPKSTLHGFASTLLIGNGVFSRINLMLVTNLLCIQATAITDVNFTDV